MFKPMLALNCPKELRFYPMLVSPKLDGVRATVQRDSEGMLRLFSREGLLIPNLYTQTIHSDEAYENCDGELVILGKDFNAVQSAVMSVHGEPNVRFKKFDMYHPEWTFTERYLHMVQLGGDYIEATLCFDKESLMAHHRRNVADGHEGTMIRNPHATYKCGRATTTLQQLLKLKDFQDAEAIVTGWTTQKNDPAMLGALLADFNGITIKIGTGFTQEQKRSMMTKETIGKIAKFKYQEITVKGKPRFLGFLGFRQEGL